MEENRVPVPATSFLIQGSLDTMLCRARPQPRYSKSQSSPFPGRRNPVRDRGEPGMSMCKVRKSTLCWLERAWSGWSSTATDGLGAGRLLLTRAAKRNEPQHNCRVFLTAAGTGEAPHVPPLCATFMCHPCGSPAPGRGCRDVLWEMG